MEGIPQKPDLGQGKDFIIDQARTSRQLRAANQKNEAAALVIQRTIRRYIDRRKFRNSCMWVFSCTFDFFILTHCNIVSWNHFYYCSQQLDDLMSDFDAEKKENAPSLEIFVVSYYIVKRFDKKADVSFLEKLCRWVVKNNVKVVLGKEALPWCS